MSETKKADPRVVRFEDEQPPVGQRVCAVNDKGHVMMCVRADEDDTITVAKYWFRPNEKKTEVDLTGEPGEMSIDQLCEFSRIFNETRGKKSPAEIKKGLEACGDGCCTDALDYIMYLEEAVRNLEEVLDSVARRAMKIVNDARWRRVHEQQEDA